MVPAQIQGDAFFEISFSKVSADTFSFGEGIFISGRLNLLLFITPVLIL